MEEVAKQIIAFRENIARYRELRFKRPRSQAEMIQSRNRDAVYR